MLLYLDRDYFRLENLCNFSPAKSHEETAWLAASNGGKNQNNFSLPLEIAADDPFCWEPLSTPNRCAGFLPQSHFLLLLKSFVINQQSLATAISTQAHLMFQRFQSSDGIIQACVPRQSLLPLSMFEKLFFVCFCLFRNYCSDEERCFSSFCCRIWQTWENSSLFFFFASKGMLRWCELWGVPACITA